VVLVDPSVPYGQTVARLMRRVVHAPPRRLGQMDVWANVQADLRR
jgi:hypothetical protein